jgi:hypothetical protein
VGLLSEPGRGFCQYLAFFTQLPILTTELAQFLSFGAGEAIVTLAVIAVGLGHPVADRLSGEFELLSKFSRGSSSPRQFDDLVAIFKRIGGKPRHNYCYMCAEII